MPYVRHHMPRERILDFISSYSEAHGFPPTRREIAEHIGMQASNVNRYLHMLQGQGVIDMKPKQARSIRVVE